MPPKTANLTGKSSGFNRMRTRRSAFEVISKESEGEG